jgi:hypothetical protein
MLLTGIPIPPPTAELTDPMISWDGTRSFNRFPETYPIMTGSLLGETRLLGHPVGPARDTALPQEIISAIASILMADTSPLSMLGNVTG